MANLIQFKRGAVASIPTGEAGEPLFATDTKKLYISDGSSPLGVVMDSLFDAHCIIASISDNTPIKVEVGEDTIIGRKAGGNIEALAKADVLTILDAATKSYVDSVAQGLKVHEACKVATTGNITLENEQTIDGILTSGDRVLVKDQTDPKQNGIYVSQVGAWSRATDMDEDDEVAGSFVFITDGNLNSNTGWVCTNEPEASVVGTNDITFSQFSNASYIDAGSGLVKTGNSLAVDGVLEDLFTLGAPSSDGEFIVATGAGIFAYESGNTVRTSLGLENVSNLKDKLDAMVAPTADNDISEGYSVGSIWCDITNDKAYICLDNTDGAAVWAVVTTYLEGTPTQNESNKAPTSGWAYNHDVATTGVHGAGTNTLLHSGSVIDGGAFV